MLYRPKHFKLQELVSARLYAEAKHEYLWRILDGGLLYTADCLRDKFGKTIINTWVWGGEFQYRGLREFDCPIGAKYSMHKYGRALDMSFVDITAAEVREYIMSHPDDFPYITRMENKVTWLHMDTTNHDGKGLTLFNP